MLGPFRAKTLRISMTGRGRELADALQRPDGAMPRPTTASEPDGEPSSAADTRALLLRLFGFARPRLGKVLLAYIGRFYARVESMSRMLTLTQRASAAAQRLFEILDRVPSVLAPKVPVPLGSAALGSCFLVAASP